MPSSWGERVNVLLYRPVWVHQRPNNGWFLAEKPVEGAGRGAHKGRAALVSAVTHLEGENVCAHVGVKRLPGSVGMSISP
jgi:hypothetical protein